MIIVPGYACLFTVEGLRTPKADDWFKPIRENKGFGSLREADVEAHHAVLATCLVWFGAIAVYVYSQSGCCCAIELTRYM